MIKEHLVIAIAALRVCLQTPMINEYYRFHYPFDVVMKVRLNLKRFARFIKKCRGTAYIWNVGYFQRVLVINLYYSVRIHSKNHFYLTIVSKIFRIRLFVFVYSLIRFSFIRILSFIRKHLFIRIHSFIHLPNTYSRLRYSFSSAWLLFRMITYTIYKMRSTKQSDPLHITDVYPILQSRLGLQVQMLGSCRK